MSTVAEDKKESLIEKLEDDDAWTDVPRSARTFVYATLRREVHEAMRRGAEAELLVTAAAVSESAQDAVDNLSTAHHIIAGAFACALNILESEDEELCRECGDFHAAESPHANPKDVS